METSDDLTTLLPMILLGVIFIVIVILVLPQLDNLSNNQSDSFDENQSGSTLNPLQEIFLEYKHSSVSDWINWITHQDISKKNAAFEKLVAYLGHEPEGIGSLVTDVIKAVIAFNYPESFTSLYQLIENVRKRWGSYQTADQFYAQASIGLVELNQERSQSLLINEFELIKSKRDPQRFMISILDALSKLPSNSELDDFWFKALTDPLCELPVKERVVSLVAGKDVESRLSVIAPLFKFWNKSEMGKVPDNDVKVLENIFYTNQDLILNDNYELWDLVLDACKHKITETLFVGLVVSLLENKKIDVKETLLLQLFESGHKIRTEFLEILAIKQSLSSEELIMIQEEYVLDAKESEEIINITKFHAHKDVPDSLEDTYQHLVRALSLNQESKNHNLPVLNLIPGASSSDKYYLMECLAANHEYKLLNVNLSALLGSITELAKFKLLITQNKPCLIYFYGFHELIGRKFNDIETSSIEILSKLLKEFKVTTGINFLLDIEVSHEDLNNSNELLECIEKVFHTKYGLVKDIDKPNLLSRQKILNDHVKKLTETRINSSAGLELIAKETEDYSLIEFLAYINSYMRFCLLVYGELKSPADLYQALMISGKANQDAEPAI